MTIFEMLQQSLILTILGMAVVFSFLWIMIICVNLTGKIINQKIRNNDAPQLTAGMQQEANGTLASAHIAAITAAVSEHQKGE